MAGELDEHGAQALLVEEVLAHLSVGVAVVRASDGRVLHANTAWSRLCGHAHVVDLDGLELRGDVNVSAFAHPDLGQLWVLVQSDVPVASPPAPLQDEFLEMVAHELRTPLSAIVGFVDLLRRHHTRFDRAQTVDVLDRAGASARELDDLLGRMLIWSRLHADRVTMLARPLRLYEVIAAQVVALAPLLEGREVQVDVDEALTVWADRVGLVQILDNLLANAAAFSTPGTLISIRARSENRREVRVEIEDRGPGFEPAEQAHLFDRASQIAMSPRARGAGLGLSIAARYIELHGGHIGVISTPGTGSAFWFTLPTIPESGALDAPRHDDADR